MIYSVVELSKHLGISRGAIYSYAKRGDIVLVNGKFNTDNPTNSEYLKLREESKKEIETELSVIGGNPEKKRPTKKIQSEDEAAKEFAEVLTGVEIKKLKAKKTKEEVKFLRLRNEKLEGSLIPTDLVGRAVAEVVVRYKTSFVQNVDQLLRDFANENSVDNSKLTSVLAKLTILANEVSERADIEAKIAIENSLSESMIK
ncbi:MAG: hypothetical protein H6Q17_547 [Bacteroidetes bacterium]|nr:hypothetical protein [Bacteroidota bacterium]